MTNDVRFEKLWNDYLEGELDESGMAELQQLLGSDESFLRAAADSFQVHRLLGLNAEYSETRHEDFVRATMAKLPSGGAEFVDDVMRKLPMPGAGKSSRYVLLSGLTAVALLFIAALLLFKSTTSPEVARITGLHGSVQWTGAGGIVREVTEVGHVLQGGTLETLSADAWADFLFRDGTTVTVSGRSLLTLSEREQKIVRLRYGNVSANVAPQPAGRPMLVHTPVADLHILGTQFNVDAQPETTRLVVNEGRVRLKRIRDGKEVDVDAQHEITASIADDNGLVPLQRADAITAWKSDLKSDVVYGKWIPELAALALQLKQAVAGGQMTKSEAITAYKDAATLDNATGSVWATPAPIGSLVVLSVSQSLATPVVLAQDARFRIRGRLHSPADVEFGMSVNEPNGGFAGKFSVTVSRADIRGEDDIFDLVLPIHDFREITDLGNSPTGQELRDWWCVTKSNSTKLEILSVELVGKVLASHELNAEFVASPSGVGDSLILRSTTHLYCIENGHQRTAEQVAADVYPERREGNKVPKTLRTRALRITGLQRWVCS